MVGSWMRAQHELFEVTAGDQLLVLLHCAKKGLDGRPSGNRSTFFTLVPCGKGEISFQNVHFDFLKIG